MSEIDYAEVFEDAAEILEHDGWIQGALRAREGYCAVGALQAALFKQRITFPLGSRGIANSTVGLHLCMMLCQLIGKLPTSSITRSGAPQDIVMEWNDMPGRNANEVLDLLHAAAKKAQGVEP